jgi:small subunit ribosomal protein S1
MEGDPYTSYIATHEKNAITRATVKSVDARGAVMMLDGDVEGYLRASEFSRDRIEDLSQHLKVGDVLEAMIINVDRKTRGINLSIKAKDQAEQHEAMQKIATDNAASGTTNLGALLKAKLNNQG